MSGFSSTPPAALTALLAGSTDLSMRIGKPLAGFLTRSIRSVSMSSRMVICCSAGILVLPQVGQVKRRGDAAVNRALHGNASAPAFLDIRPAFFAPPDADEPVTRLDKLRAAVSGLNGPVRTPVDVGLDNLASAVRAFLVPPADVLALRQVVPGRFLNVAFFGEVLEAVTGLSDVGSVSRVGHHQRVAALVFGLDDDASNAGTVPRFRFRCTRLRGVVVIVDY